MSTQTRDHDPHPALPRCFTKKREVVELVQGVAGQGALANVVEPDDEAEGLTVFTPAASVGNCGLFVAMTWHSHSSSGTVLTRTRNWCGNSTSTPWSRVADMTRREIKVQRNEKGSLRSAESA